MTVSEALLIAENTYNSLKNLTTKNWTKETTALVILAQRVRELSRAK